MKDEKSAWVWYIFKGNNPPLTWRFNPRTAGGLSHLRMAGGGGADDRPPEISKTKKDSDKP